jgi:beta-N-acetylhexosaminidase
VTRDDLRDDVGQLLWLGFYGTEPSPELHRLVADGAIGATVLFKRNLRLSREPMPSAPAAGHQASLGAQAAAGRIEGERLPEASVSREIADLGAVAELNRALHAAVAADRPPLLTCVDHEGGRVQRVRAPATLWPPMMQLDGLDASDAASLAEQVGRAIGDELAALGFDVDFAPVLDVHTNPDNPIIGDRAFGSLPGPVADRALAFARGLEAAGVLPCGKHFPGHGDTSTDSHLELPRLEHDLDRLRAVELEPFRRAAAAGLPMIMTAHVVFAALEDGVPATLSRRVITDLLRGELGYRGVVVSDDLDMRAIADHVGVAEAAVGAVAAGCDALLICVHPEKHGAAWEALVRAGEAGADMRARIGEAAARVRELKRRHAAGARPAPNLDRVGHAEHLRLAERLGGRGGAGSA